MYKWWCGARGRKLEESKLNWALLAEVVRRGGLGMPLLMRLTFIPGHCASFPFLSLRFYSVFPFGSGEDVQEGQAS